MAYKVFTNGSVLNASEINENLMNQSVMVFSNSAARDAALTAPVEGMLTWLQDSNKYQYRNGSSAWVDLGGGGAILQVVSTAKTDTFVSSSVAGGGATAITDLTATITPSSTSSKLLITTQVTGISQNYPGTAMALQLTSGGSVITAATGNAAGSRTRITASGYLVDNQTQFGTIHSSFMFSPASTSSLTIGVNVVNMDASSNVLYVNRGFNDGDGVDRGRAISTLTVMEVAG